MTPYHPETITGHVPTINLFKIFVTLVVLSLAGFPVLYAQQSEPYAQQSEPYAQQRELYTQQSDSYARPGDTYGAYTTPAEDKLANLINEYRRSKKLAAVPVSRSLTKVAQLHAQDLAENYKAGKNCNLHSWSNDPRWSSCCYTPDHRKASCMWDKPRELTGYQGDGYEIAYFSNFDYQTDEEFVKDALKGWKESRGHHELIANLGKWKTAEWKAMGIGIHGDYVVVWFGELPDATGSPELLRYQ